MKPPNLLDKESIRKLLLRRTIINPTAGCWLYIWKLHKTGYAYVKICRRSFSVHRLSFWIFQDFDLKSNWKILHKQECNTKNCWNPEHLYVGTQKQNVRDSIEFGNHYIFGERMA